MEYNELVGFVGLSIVEIYFYENQILFKMSNGSFYELTNYIDYIGGDLQTLIGNPLVELFEVIDIYFDEIVTKYSFKTNKSMVEITFYKTEMDEGVELKQISKKDFDLKVNELKEIESKKEGSVLIFK